jgi:peptidoglycan/xylan/chitin deacetylase (PgdA/CDA1 family)
MPRRRSYFLKFVFYPTILVFCFAIIIAKLVSLFLIPEWSPAISTVLLILGAGAVGRLSYKNIRLIVAEVRYSVAGGLLTLPPLHFLQRRELVAQPRNQFARQLINVGVILLVFTGGWFASKSTFLPFQPSPQTSSACVPKQEPLPPVANDVPNSSMEDVNTSGQPIGWQTTSTGHNNTQFSSVPGYQSKRALSVTIKNYQDGTGMWLYSPQPARAGQTYQYSDWYQATGTSSLMLMYVFNGATHYQVIDKTISASQQGWTHYSKSFELPNPKEGEQLAVSVIHALGSAGTLTIDDIAFRPETKGFVRPMISFTFDDGWLSQYKTGLPLLCKYHVPATFFLISGYFGYPAYMYPNQVRTLIQDGEEIADHTVDHENLAKLPTQRVQWELSYSQHTLQQLFGQKIVDFATPYGSYNEGVLQEAHRLFESHRSSTVGLNGPGHFDPYNIQCVTYDDTTTLDQFKYWIDQAIQTHQWLVLTFHQVDTSGQEYSVSPKLLEQILAYTASHPEIRPMTMAQALAEIDQQI